MHIGRCQIYGTTPNRTIQVSAARIGHPPHRRFARETKRISKRICIRPSHNARLPCCSFSGGSWFSFMHKTRNTSNPKIATIQSNGVTCWCCSAHCTVVFGHGMQNGARRMHHQQCQPPIESDGNPKRICKRSTFWSTYLLNQCAEINYKLLTAISSYTWIPHFHHQRWCMVAVRARSA